LKDWGKIFSMPKGIPLWKKGERGTLRSRSGKRGPSCGAVRGVKEFCGLKEKGGKQVGKRGILFSSIKKGGYDMEKGRGNPPPPLVKRKRHL